MIGSAFELARNDLDLDAADAFALEADPGGCRLRQVDDAVVLVGTAVAHLHLDLAAVGEVGDAQPRVKRQGAVGGGKLVPVEGVARRRAPALPFGAVPGSEADLPIGRIPI